MKFLTSSQSRSGWIGVSSERALPPGRARFSASPSASRSRQALKRSASKRPSMASISCSSAVRTSATMPMSMGRGLCAISVWSMSIRTMRASALKRGGAAWPTM